MSSQICNCGFPEYRDFKTGLTFKEVYSMLKIEQTKKYERGVYMFITRHTILGRWHEIKLTMYSCEQQLHDKICNQ
ncbi:MAG: hypothetical protein AB1432_11690 [Bacteroidota bacterium]